MKNLFIGLLATGFITLSSFKTLSTSNNEKLEEIEGYGCCTAHNKSGSQSVTICGDFPSSEIRCANAVAAYHAIY